MATIQYKVMIKRVKATKIGDVFEVKISDTEKKYMQYIASDLTCLNSDVVRGFMKTYNVDNKPSLEEIVSDEVDFYAHCDSRAGIKLEYWTLYGNSQNVGNVKDAIFRGTNDFGDKISHEWYIWHINEDFIHVNNDDPRLRRSNNGPVYSAKRILLRVKEGYFYGIEPRFE